MKQIINFFELGRNAREKALVIDIRQETFSLHVNQAEVSSSDNKNTGVCTVKHKILAKCSADIGEKTNLTLTENIFNYFKGCCHFCILI